MTNENIWPVSKYVSRASLPFIDPGSKSLVALIEICTVFNIGHCIFFKKICPVNFKNFFSSSCSHCLNDITSISNNVPLISSQNHQTPIYSYVSGVSLPPIYPDDKIKFFFAQVEIVTVFNTGEYVSFKTICPVISFEEFFSSSYPNYLNNITSITNSPKTVRPDQLLTPLTNLNDKTSKTQQPAKSEKDEYCLNEEMLNELYCHTLKQVLSRLEELSIKFGFKKTYSHNNFRKKDKEKLKIIIFEEFGNEEDKILKIINHFFFSNRKNAKKIHNFIKEKEYLSLNNDNARISAILENMNWKNFSTYSRKDIRKLVATLVVGADIPAEKIWTFIDSELKIQCSQKKPSSIKTRVFINSNLKRERR